MSTTLYISLDADAPGFDPNASDRVLMCECMPGLDKLARQLGVKPLGALMSYQPADVPGFFGRSNIALLPPVQFFDPREALATIEALTRHLEAHPQTFATARGRDRTNDLLVELRECGDVLSAVAQANRQFRFWIGE